MLRQFVKALCPPVLLSSVKALERKFRAHASDRLFDGDDALFKASFSPATVYAEYGCGASTLWVHRRVGCRVLAVDSSPQWIRRVSMTLNSDKAASEVSLHLADLGETGDWGMPLSYQYSGNFQDYTDWIWQQEERPDVVLIDGRFRVCCFLTCLLNADKGSKIFFDDYAERAQYHYVERHLKPYKYCGRQALFVMPDSWELDLPEIRRDLERFRFVFD